MTANHLKPARVNLAILTYNALDYTKMCLDSIARNTKCEHNVFVLDNGSKDDSRPWLAQQKRPNFYFEEAVKNLGVPGGRNRLIEIITPLLPDEGFVVFLDNDMELKEGWDEAYLAFFRDHPEAGIASAFGHRMIVRQHYRELLPPPAYSAPVDVACGGFCCWIRANALRAVKGFDENLGLFWHEDDDFSVRTIAAGYDVYSLPHVPVVHHEHKSGAANPGIKAGGSPKNQAYLCDKWRKMGVVDAEGRIIRRDRPQGLFNSKGTPLDMGGYRWLERQTEFTASDTATGIAQLRFSSAKKEYYDSFPLSVEVSVDGTVASRLTFAASDETQDVSFALRPGSRVGITCSSEFSPFLNGLGFQAAALAAIRVEGWPEGAFSVNQKQESGSASPITWVSSIFDTDEYSNFTQAILPKLAEKFPSLRLEPQRLNEDVLNEMKQDVEWFAGWKNFCKAPARGGTLVIAGDPLDASGKSYYRAVRDLHPECSRAIGFIIVRNAKLTKAWIDAALCADEIWVQTRSEQEKLVQAGVPATKIQVLSVGVDASVFSPALEPQPTPLFDDRFCYFARVNSVDDPFLRTCVAAHLKAFSAADKACLAISIAPTGGQIPAEALRSLVSDPNAQVEQCAPVFSMNPSSAPRIRSVHYKRFAGYLTAQGSSRVAECAEAMASGLPLIVVSPTDGSSKKISLFEDGEWERQVNADSGEFPLEICLHPALVDNLASTLRAAFTSWGSDYASRQQRSESVTKVFSITSVVDAIATRLGDSTRKLAPQVPATQSRPETKIHIVSDEQVTVGVDVRTLTYLETMERGIGQYTLHHLMEIFTQRPEWKFILYRDPNEETDPLKKLASFPNARLSVIGEQHRDNLDLYHIPDPMTILGGFDSPFLLAPQEVPLSVTFYDLIPIVKREMHFDCWEPWRKKTYSRRIEQLLASNAQVLAISECTRQDLHRFTSYPLGGITTIMAGVNRAETQPSEARVRQVLERFGLTSPFFMSVGGLDGHKGFVATANAYVSVVGARKVQFAVVGSFNDPNKENFRKAFDANKIPGVVFTGYLNREEMACIYAASHGLIFPSHYEGFGFPVLEAMAHGCPAITTNVSSLPEVAGDAGLLVPVDSPPAIAEAMRRLLDEPGLRGEMSRKGLAQAQNFSWQKSAGITLEVWENLLREPEIHRGRRSIEAVRM